VSDQPRPARRRGGAQIIPRPSAWQLGAPAPWADGAPRATIDLDVLAATITARGPGRPMDVEFPRGRHSAVLLALFPGERGAEVVLTRRSQSLANHKGEISFPGGRLDPGETPVQAALREAHEEVALDPDLVTVVGELDHIATMVSHSHIVPVVGTLARRPMLRASAGEVDRILTAPLVDLLDAEVYREERWGQPPLDRAIHFFELDDETVWGATGRIMVQLLSIATGVAR
jgi:8-oxo-dGTP pyrophosphatase MutT (NUDIX family)